MKLLIIAVLFMVITGCATAIGVKSGDQSIQKKCRVVEPLSSQEFSEDYVCEQP